ncbi:MAG TPA: NAD(P) transhydrogenase subunit alpha [Phycisphaerae bacterium]|nr:NAD(P) transhydrogenase subunit alpha [Phycisphaerae bacterium]HRY69685.1 NAD(P) transhydrogenase subunit alpha [Phycisphaerae bacterium]HSA25118.1 NAD(P) transhydrogenase subunit alpha [Phycisphaerae bacterium]
MIIGVPKEILEEEKRVAALPETVKKYTAMGFEVLVETLAGKGVFRADSEYAAAGAKIVADAKTLFDRADVVLKVKQPHFNKAAGKSEAEMLRPGTILITFLHPAAPPNHGMIKTLRDRNVTAFTMDGIPRISRAQTMDALTSMSTVTGYRSVLIAAGHFPRFIPMIGTAIGVIQPAQVLVIGAGVVGLQAIAAAKRLGGVVKAFDIRPEARREAGSLKGTQVVGFEVPEELALGEGGYAKALPTEWLDRERAALRNIVPQVDIIILSALIPGEVAPVLITEEMVRSMRPGSVIVDVSIDQGGNCAVTTPGRETVVNDVFVCGTANIPGSMAVDASWLYAHNMLHYVENLFKDGPGRLNMDDEIVRHSLVTKEGKILHQGALKAMKQTGTIG